MDIASRVAISAAALLFAVAHLPNLPLAAATLVWGAVSCATEYHIYRGPLTGLPSGDYGSCLDSIDPDRTDTTLLDTTIPALGRGFFYLITAENSLGQEGTLGYASSGERPNPSPCP